MSQKIAFFDFDGTITTKDTLLEFIKHSRGSFRFYLGFILNSPWLIAYKIKLISNQKAKERILQFFFRNTPVDLFEQQCERFSREILPQLIRPKALREIARLKESGASVVIVSASPENWIRSWSDSVEASLLATRLEIKPAPLPHCPCPAAASHPGATASAGSAPLAREAAPQPGATAQPEAAPAPLNLTPRLSRKRPPRPPHRQDLRSPIVTAEEKVRRINECYLLTDYNEIYTYGDTGGDRPMLRLGTLSFL